jgi:hypothetical protein
MNRLVLLAVAVVCNQAALANCDPGPADAQRDCNSCGNLEQNPERGIDNVWNSLLHNGIPQVDHGMRAALNWNGFATVNLMYPPHASPGVLFYRGIIRDPSFSITNSATYSQALALQAQLNLNSRMPGHFKLRAEIRYMLATSTTTGTDPYVVSLYDQDGNLIAREEIERGESILDRASFGLNDLDADPRYERSECIDKDPRYNGEETGHGTSGGGGGWGGGGGGLPGPPSTSIVSAIRCGTSYVDSGRGRRTCMRL